MSRTGGVIIMVLYSGASPPKYGMGPPQPQLRLPVVLSVGWMKSLDASRVLVTTVSQEAIRAAVSPPERL